MKNLTIFIENMLDELYFDYSKRLKSLFKVTDEWNSEAERIFCIMDEDKKGHIDAEVLQFWVASILLSEIHSIEPIFLRKQTETFLQEMKHTNGLVTMRGWKNYLIRKNWKTFEALKALSEDFIIIVNAWKHIRTTVFGPESLANYIFLNSSDQDLPSIWNQCILSSVSSFSNLKSDTEKMHKFLRFVGLQLGSTPNFSTKGILCLQGTYIKHLGEFSIYIMANYLQLAGQHHTTASISSLTQEAIDTLCSDPRFKVIRKALQTYDNLLNIILYEIIAKCKKPVKPSVSKSTTKLQYSSTSSILSTKIRSKTPTQSMKIVPKPIKSATPEKKVQKDFKTTTYSTQTLKNSSFSSSKSQNSFKGKNNSFLGIKNVEIKKIFSKASNSSSKTLNKPKSPIKQASKETYEQVMKRLTNK